MTCRSLHPCVNTSPRDCQTFAGAWLIPCFVTAALLAGCARPKTTPPFYSNRDATDAEWQAGASRRPTPRTLQAFSRILVAQGKIDQAQTVLANAIRQDAGFLPAYVDLADLLMRRGRSEQAIAVLRAGLKTSPRDPVLHNNLGMACLAAGRHAQALESFQQACALAPGNGRYLANHALALGLLGRYDEALAAYQRVLPARDAHYNLALLCQLRHDKGRAGREFALAAGQGEAADAAARANTPSRITSAE